MGKRYRPIQIAHPNREYPAVTESEMVAYLSDPNLKGKYRFEELENVTVEMPPEAIRPERKAKREKEDTLNTEAEADKVG